MGCGKSTIGRELAELLGYTFVDLDAYIEDTEYLSIPEIFKLKGEKGFRLIEQQCLKELGKLNKVVIATGGGTPCFFDNQDWMNENGTTVYLKTSPELLFKRLKSQTAQRPLLADKTEEELKDFIDSKLQERKVFYENAELTYEQYEEGTQVAAHLAMFFREK